jgi:hypothetical protein
VRLSSEQIEDIKEIIDHGGIDIQSLKDDVLDHLCCVIEIKISRGKSYDEAVSESLHELAPNGLEEIQNETVFLLNSNKIIAMKRIMYFIGLLSAMSFVLGWTFGMMHWPGGTELSVGGFLGFTCIYIPLYTIDYFKAKIHRALSEKLRLSLGIVSALAVTASVIFKLLHYPGADQLLLSGAGLFIFGFLPFLFFTMYKKSVA